MSAQGGGHIRTDYRALVEERGYIVLYRHQEPNHCPGCGRAAWHVGRSTAECANCGTAIPLMTPHREG